MEFLIVNVCITVGLLGLILYFLYEIAQAKRERNILIRQNLVYLISFVEFFDWLDKKYVPHVVGTVLGNTAYLEFVKKLGLPEKAFSDILEGAVTESNIQLQAKATEVLHAIKQPLSSEIDSLLGDK